MGPHKRSKGRRSIYMRKLYITCTFHKHNFYVTRQIQLDKFSEYKQIMLVHNALISGNWATGHS